MHAPTLTDPANRKALLPREQPYWNILAYCRHIGFRKFANGPGTWHARLRDRYGRYKQTRLSSEVETGADGLSYDQALKLAQDWFNVSEQAGLAAAPQPVGVSMALRFSPTPEGNAVGDALLDFIEWKRIAATPQTFQVLVSLINHHILPRIGKVKIEEFAGSKITAFCRDILETPPKRGKQQQARTVRIADLSPDALRRRKSTVNTVLGILRVALRMAWESGRTESERPWRRIHRLPNMEVPRQIFLTRDQCRSLIAASRPDLAELVRAALYSGCRVTELSDLRAGDVGRDIFGILIRPGKSRRSRHVFLPDEGMRFFLSRAAGKADDEFVFRTQLGHLWRGNHKHLFKDAVQYAGLPIGFVFHGLRHTYASQLVQAGTPLAIVARQLGHANTDTVSRTYGHLSCASIERELALRFSPIEPVESLNGNPLTNFRASLQGTEPTIAITSWPRSNFSASRDELVGVIKNR